MDEAGAPHQLDINDSPISGKNDPVLSMNKTEPPQTQTTVEDLTINSQPDSFAEPRDPKKDFKEAFSKFKQNFTKKFGNN